MSKKVYGRSDYILRDRKTGKYVGLFGTYTSVKDKARVFSGSYLKDIRTVNHRIWKDDFTPIEVR